MNKKEYLEIVKKYTPHEDNLKDYILSFISGGLIGMTGELIKLFLINNCNLTKSDATSYVILIAISMLMTLIAGLIPAQIASKKDPVVALRTE